MAILRRRLASYALTVALLQCALLFAAPVSACCGPGNFRLTAEATNEAEATTPHECCPAGAHAPGQCPLHKAAHSRQCAFRCGASHAPDLVIGAIGVLTPPSVTSVNPPTATTRPAARPPALLARTILPDAPPPESL
jgi:hypothetical protein